MPIEDIADSLTDTTYDHPVAVVYLADKLEDFDAGLGGTLSSRLHVDVLELKAAPGIDSAVLTYHRGTQIHFGAVAFVEDAINQDDLQGKWIKIAIGSIPPWFGLIDTIETAGAIVGTFKVMAVGVLKMAEHAHVRTAHCWNAAGSEIVTLGVGLPFNTDARDFFGTNGNRDDETWDDPFPHYLFSRENRGRDLWTAHTAVKYLLAHHAPANYYGSPVPEWSIDPATEAASPVEWYECQVETDGKTLKQLLDELIPRKRAVSYYAAYDDTQKKIVLRMFSFARDRIVVRSEPEYDVYLEANPNLKELTLDESIWFTNDSIYVESIDAQYDKVIGQGERCTSTFSMSFDPTHTQFVKDWSTADETDYKNADEPTDKLKNAAYRAQDRLAHVYCRFKISDDWDGLTWTNAGVDDPQYWADPNLDADGNPKQPNEIGSSTGQPMRVHGIKLLSRLPLNDRIDYSGDKLASLNVASQLSNLTADGENDPENLAPMFWVYEAGPYYTLLDKLATVSEANPAATSKRRWSCHVSISHHEPSVQLRVTSGYQTMLARSDFTSPAPTGDYGPEWDPIAKNGLEYTEIGCTICAEWEHRLTCEKVITDAPEDRQERILYLDARNARLDYLSPQTVVAVKSGELIRSDGGWLRDDRPRVQSLVNATAEWYGRMKRALTFSFRQLRPLVSIGDLITTVTGIATKNGVRLPSQVNTPVTSITYSMGSGGQGGSTKVETGFAEIDFS